MTPPVEIETAETTVADKVDGPLMNHSYDGIQEYDNPLPGWWRATFWASIVFAAGYWVWFHVAPWHSTPDSHYQESLVIYNEGRELRAAREAANVSEDSLAQDTKNSETLTRGASIFATRCASCHTEDGRGLIGPNLTDNFQLHGSTRMDIYNTISGGVQGTAMPAWGEQMPATDIVAVAAFVIPLRGKNIPGKAPDGHPVDRFEKIVMSINVPTDRVLSTLNQDGTRRWIRPKLAHGRFLNRRRAVALGLVALFVLLPRIRINGRPGFLIDVVSQEIDVFGLMFRPSDGFVLALLGLTIVLAVFLLTAMFGRVWCGWGCPQTVYLEHLFRPIERLFEGSRGQRATLWRRITKWIAFIALSFALSNVFLAYFVGTDRLEQWVFHSPLEHPGGFGIVVGTAALMLFDFGWFREQMCTLACPYGRLQSVLLDKQSLIVGYDVRRGEPRQQPKKKLPVLGNAGDCVDCGACVAVCPTGIDIREGLQMECTTCTQCIDACDTVMDKLGRKRGLIRYTSQDELAGKTRSLMRLRTIAYPLLLAISLGGLVYTVVSRTGTEVWVERINGKPFVELPNGDIAAQARLKLENQTDEPHRYHLSLAQTNYAILRSQTDFELKPHKSLQIPVFIDVPRSSFKAGKRTAHIRIDDSTGFQRIVTVTLLGPEQ